jgi:hypothetical protein
MARPIKRYVLTPMDGDCQIKRLEHALINWANDLSGFDCETIHEPENDTALVLAMNGIHDYLEDFVTLTYKKLDELQPIKGKNGAKIRISKEGQPILKLIIAHHHYASSRLGEVLDPVNTTKVSFMIHRKPHFGKTHL